MDTAERDTNSRPFPPTKAAIQTVSIFDPSSLWSMPWTSKAYSLLYKSSYAFSTPHYLFVLEQTRDWEHAIEDA